MTGPAAPSRQRALDQLRERNPLPGGTLTVGAGILLLGVTAYGFLIVAARALGPSRFAPLSVMYTIVFLAAPGLFIPLEQEVGRALSARRARGVGGRPLVVRAAVAGGVASLAVAILVVLARRPLLDRLFDGDSLMLVALITGVAAYAVEYLARGTLAANGRFVRYSALVGAEGSLRAGGAAVLWAAGVTEPAAYGLLIGIPPVIAAVGAVTGAGRLAGHGPPAPWSELSSRLGFLLLGSLLGQTLVNIGPVAVRLLAPSGDSAAASRFLAGLVLSRVPLFLFQAVQASLLPRLAAHAAAGRRDEFRTVLLRLVAFVSLLGVLATLLAWALGPWAVRVLFGGAYELGHADLALLAGASAAYMVALALAQGLIALRGHGRAVIAWAAGVAVFAGVLAVVGGVVTRVEVSLLCGSATSLLVMAALLRERLAHPAPLPNA